MNALPKLKPRSKYSHKGQNGVVVVIGGSEDYIGAPAFVGMAALATMRAGADLCYVAAPEKVAWAINCLSPDLITKKLPGKYLQQKHLRTINQLVEKADAVVIGNGMGLRAETVKLVNTFVRQPKKVSLVVDADALKMIHLQDVRHSVLTPHEGEYQSLIKNSHLEGKKIQPLLKDNVLVRKGHPKTIIMTREKTTHNTTGNPGMTHGGSGDVLAGIIAGLIAQGNDLFTSARIAAFVNGKAAEALYKQKGFGYLASDLVSKFPEFLKKFQGIK